jgi:ribosome maturation factor RimP
VLVPWEAIAEARLILTDDLIRDALSKDNRARKEAKKRRGEEAEPSDPAQEAGNGN